MRKQKRKLRPSQVREYSEILHDLLVIRDGDISATAVAGDWKRVNIAGVATTIFNLVAPATKTEVELLHEMVSCVGV